MENKQEICNKLCETLKLTRSAYDLVSLEYIEETETVLATFENGSIKINVACDSGIAMIRDICKFMD